MLSRLAVVYLARGADKDCLGRFSAFILSYKTFKAGLDHRLFVIFKGFADQAALRRGEEAFSAVDYTPIHVEDRSFDIGAYIDAARQIEADRLFFLNTNSIISAYYWLAKLSANLDRDNVGAVGATGSFESLDILDPRFPGFPNIHLRSNAFMLRRDVFLEITAGLQISDKMDAYMTESGPDGLTRRLFRMGLEVLIVGNDGRGYSPTFWASSQTFRQGQQKNLLVRDNVTDTFDRASFPEKRVLCLHTWGGYIADRSTQFLPSVGMPPIGTVALPARAISDVTLR